MTCPNPVPDQTATSSPDSDMNVNNNPGDTDPFVSAPQARLVPLVPPKRRRDSTPDSHSLPSTVTSADPPSNISVSTEYSSSPVAPVAPVEESSNVDSNQSQPATSTPDEFSSHSDEQCSNVNPLHPDTFSTSPTHFPSPSRDPFMSFFPGLSSDAPSFDDPNCIPSAFIPSEDLCDWSTDQMGMYTFEEYAQMLEREQPMPHNLADSDTDNAPHFAAEELPSRATRWFDEIFAAIDDVGAAIEATRPPALLAMAVGSAPPPRNCTPPPPLPQYPAARRRTHQSSSVQPHQTTQPSASRHVRFETLPPAPVPPPTNTPILRKLPTPSNNKDKTVQSTRNAVQPPPKTPRRSSLKTSMPSPEPSAVALDTTPVSSRLRSASSNQKAGGIRSSSNGKNTSAGPSSRRNSKTKVETATPSSAAPVSPRRLRSSDVKPSPITKKKGNPTPRSWETAPLADKIMSHMKETAQATSVTWNAITAAWNGRREEGAEAMSWRSLCRRYIRIKDRIGVWTGFDDALLEVVQGYSELTAEDSERIAGELSEKFGWEINPLACESRYQALKEEGRVDEKGKGKARQK